MRFKITNSVTESKVSSDSPGGRRVLLTLPRS